MEKLLGRKLSKGDFVHHIDRNKNNNNLDNLFLTDVKQHARIHADLNRKIQKLVEKAIESEVLRFSKLHGKYYLDKNFDIIKKSINY